MRKLKLSIFFIFVFTSFLLLPVFAQIPHLINYQGKLTDTQGKPVPDGTHSLTFRIYDADSGGNLLWQETQNLLITKGIFSCLLGGVTELNLAFDKPYWLAIKVGSDSEMTPRQQIASAGYAMRAEKADVAERISAEKITGVLAIGQGGTGTTTTANNPNGICVLDANGYVPDNSVDTMALKTATAENFGSDMNGYYTMTGGEYIFWPQRKISSPSTYHASLGTWGGQNNTFPYTDWTSAYFVSNWPGGPTRYIRWRYITSSGTDFWFWLLLDKSTKKIIGASAAPDHPAYGNGGDFKKIPHPFINFDPATQEIVLIDQDTCRAIRQEAKNTGKSVAELVESDYKVDFSKEIPYTPLHSGKYIDDNGKQIKEIVASIPDYIKVRRLSKLTTEEKINREKTRQANMQQVEQEQQREMADRQKTIAKLKTLGLTQSEIEVLLGNQ